MNPRPERKWLRHKTPPWVRLSNQTYFITVCCEERHSPQLTQPAVAERIRESFAFRHVRGDWWVHLLTLMPDHLHALINFSESSPGQSKLISNWKRFSAREFKIDWQEGYFDHRIRDDNGFELKAKYIRMNPVRAGLCSKPEEWKFTWDRFERAEA